MSDDKIDHAQRCQPRNIAQSSLNYRRSNVNIAEMMCKLVNQQFVPEIDINVFGGNPLEFHYFMDVFDEGVGKKIEDPRGKSHV